MTHPPSFAQIVMKVLAELGGRAGAEDVATHARSVLGEDVYADRMWQGFKGQCASVMRQRSAETGLPEAPCIGGEYVQDALLTSEELRYLAVQASRRGEVFATRARAYAQRHLDVYGVAIDPATGEVLAA